MNEEEYDPKLSKRVMLLNIMTHISEIRGELAAARRVNAKHTGSGFTDRVFARLKPFIDNLDNVVAEQYQLTVNEALEH